jgi:hypothetical protein
MTDTPENIKYVIDALSVATVLGTIMSWLPAVAAVFTIIWTAIRIYETKTVQGWLGKRNAYGRHQAGQGYDRWCGP